MEARHILKDIPNSPGKNPEANKSSQKMVHRRPCKLASRAGGMMIRLPRTRETVYWVDRKPPRPPRGHSQSHLLFRGLEARASFVSVGKRTRHAENERVPTLKTSMGAALMKPCPLTNLTGAGASLESTWTPFAFNVLCHSPFSSKPCCSRNLLNASGEHRHNQSIQGHASTSGVRGRKNEGLAMREINSLEDSAQDLINFLVSCPLLVLGMQAVATRFLHAFIPSRKREPINSKTG
jgi:hypothetical protein